MVLGAVLALVRAQKIVRATIVSLSHFAKEWFEPLHGDGERGKEGDLCVFGLQGWVISPVGFYFCGTRGREEGRPSEHMNWFGWADDPSR